MEDLILNRKISHPGSLTRWRSKFSFTKKVGWRMKSMQKIVFVIITILICSSLLFPVLSPGQGKAGEIIRVTLDNGMRVVLVEDHAAPVAAFQVWVEVGSADELPTEAGISHLIEHMIFNGTNA